MKSVSVIVLALFATAAVLAQSGMRPGQWEITSEMQMPNMPAGVQMPTPKPLLQCITADQAKDPANTLSSQPGRGRGAGSDCKMSDMKTTGKTTTFTMTCTTPQKITGNVEMTFGDDTFTQTMKMVMPQGEMTTKMTGKRIGDCPK